MHSASVRRMRSRTFLDRAASSTSFASCALAHIWVVFPVLAEEASLVKVARRSLQIAVGAFLLTGVGFAGWIFQADSLGERAIALVGCAASVFLVLMYVRAYRSGGG